MKDDFEKEMENLKAPDTGFVKHHEMLKIGLMSARKSARIGILFIGIPILLVVGAYFKIKLLLRLNLFSNFEQLISKLDHSDYLSWISPMIILALPVIGIFINLLAITHFYVNKPNKELVITVCYKPKNLIVLIISALIVLSLFVGVIFINKI